MNINDISSVMELCERYEMSFLKYSVDGEEIICSKNIYRNQDSNVEAKGKSKAIVEKKDVEAEINLSMPTKDVVITSEFIGIIDISSKIMKNDETCYVGAGDVVGTIEAMKLLHEIKAPVSGNIRALVKNGAQVEFEQELFRIEVNEYGSV